MPNVVAVVRDDRVRRQIEQFLNELESEDLRVQTYKHSEEFEKAAAAAPTESTEAPTEPAPSEIHVIIFAIDSIGMKPGAWIDKMRGFLKQNRLVPAASQTRFVLLKYEDDGVSKLDVLHPALDDLLYLPLDRLIFLQKLEILFMLPKRPNPSFLFSQDVNHSIEISKITKLDRLSDVALAMRNPVPLKRGLPGKFYVNLPGEKARLEVRGKVIRSEPHPEQPGQSLVSFGYFALDRNSLSQIRRNLSKAPRYQSLRSEDREAVRYKPDDLFGTAQSERQFHIALVDPDDDAANQTAQHLAKEMDKIHIVTESSYSFFLHKYFSPQSAKNQESPPTPTTAADFYASPVSLTVNSKDLKCTAIDPVPTEVDLVLGFPAPALFSSPEGWHMLLKEPEAKLVLEEAVSLAARGRVLDKLLIVPDASDVRRAISFKIYKGSADETVTVEIGPAGLDQIMTKMSSEARSPHLDVIIVDATYVPEDVNAWVEGLRTRAAELGLSPAGEQLKFLLVADADHKINESWLSSPEILGLFIKPVDSRQILFVLSEILGNRHTLFHFDNLGWSSPAIPMHVAKKVRLEALSEYGATLRVPNPMAAGSVIFLRKSIYENAPNNCLAARVYFCAPAEDKDGYQVLLTYFGINDAFLKFARTWIRENYALQKAKGG